uniref:NADH-ubiquinone oxidoreductase chain 4L n=1 Tax=Oligolophus tienmushanensis TaxID=1508515 RepID=A0A140X732_9ARAC|nr:NADH dehydrogenase subunit 4L [Oligolophus tienmushanensis]AIG60117.1 NADH dehydrogenase subunit 4L [Oligolophus tienmushanensis]
MMMILNFYIFSMFMGGLICMVLSHYHLLVMVLSLEFLMLSIYYSLSLSMGGGMNNCLLMMLYLFVVVCEGSLGMGLLVSLVKGFGADLFGLLNLLRC